MSRRAFKRCPSCQRKHARPLVTPGEKLAAEVTRLRLAITLSLDALSHGSPMLARMVLEDAEKPVDWSNPWAC
jgi:hypothetical protein